ncbi:MAG: O-antigen ligase family protein [Solirubrobacteraceae bacterium]
MRPLQIKAQLRPHLVALVPGVLAVGLMVLWAAHDGGYDAETWYWGALVLLAVLAVMVISLGSDRIHIPRSGVIALALFGLYVAWSYLSMTWAQSPGDALQGANRALLYLLLFSLLLILPWTPEAALVAVVAFAVGIGVIAIVLVVRLAAHDAVSSLIAGSRLAAPTGYFNSTAALFTIGTLVSTCLAPNRRLPAPLRGLLLALACADLQLALIVESRGWLFTLPLVVVATIVLSKDRLRLAVFALLPATGAALLLHRLLHVFQISGSALGQGGASAGRAGLLMCAAVFAVGTLIAWTDWLLRERALSRIRRRALGTILVAATVAGAVVGGVVATGGHPIRFVTRQWNGFSHQEKVFSSQAHFGDVGSGRYDFWRVSLDAFVAHPIGGLGQDNFADYYVPRRRTAEEPSWTHSLEMRLLAHTGAVGFLLFTGFVVAALALALRGRRRGSPLASAVVAVALLPLMVWLIHGSVDWFWEMPALSGPALGFLGLAGSLGAQAKTAVDTSAAGAADLTGNPLRGRRARPHPVGVVVGGVALLAGVVVLGFPYLSIREVSLASNVRLTDPAAALSDLAQAARLNPWSSGPGRLAGAIALQTGRYAVAEERFSQAIAREPGGWFSWLGAGLAASGLGRAATAARDFKAAYAINTRQPAIAVALARAHSSRPLTYDQMLKLLIFAR